MAKVSGNVVVTAGYQIIELPAGLSIVKGQYVAFYSSAAGLIKTRDVIEGMTPDGKADNNPAVGDTLTNLANLTVQHAFRVTARATNMVFLTKVYTTKGTKEVTVRWA